MAETVKKKRGRPRKNPPKETPAAPVAAKAEKPQSEANPAPAITPEQQAQIDRILRANEQETKRQIGAILGGSAVAGLGTSPGDVEARQDRIQRDHIPGTRRKDKTHVPVTIYDDRPEVGGSRRVLDYDRFRYCMIPEDDFGTYTLNGWKFCKFDGGSLSGLLGDGWQGTGDSVFMRDIRGYCRRGDVYLMHIEVARYREILQEDKAALDKASLAPIGDFYNEGYEKGISISASIDGKSIT